MLSACGVSVEELLVSNLTLKLHLHISDYLHSQIIPGPGSDRHSIPLHNIASMASAIALAADAGLAVSLKVALLTTAAVRLGGQEFRNSIRKANEAKVAPPPAYTRSWWTDTFATLPKTSQAVEVDHFGGLSPSG